MPMAAVTTSMKKIGTRDAALPPDAADDQA